MAMASGSVRPQYFVALLAVTLCFFAVPPQQSVTAALSDAQDYIAPQPEQSAPVITAPRVLGATSSLPTAPNCRQEACIALTFDDGPNPTTTPRILDTLARENVPATFFVVGKRVAGNEALLRRMQAQGEEIGNHSWSHADLTQLTPVEIRHQVTDTQAALVAAGIRSPRLFRPPYGAVNDTVRQNVSLRIALWNEDPRDWDNKSATDVESTMLKSARPGGVIDAHDIYPATADALAPTIDKLKAQHFTFVTMSQLMNDDDPGPGHEFYGFKN